VTKPRFEYWRTTRLQSGGANPFIDPGTCNVEAETSEAMVGAIAAEESARQP